MSPSIGLTPAVTTAIVIVIVVVVVGEKRGRRRISKAATTTFLDYARVHDHASERDADN